MSLSPQEIFHQRLTAIVDAHTERGAWFAWWPVKTATGWAWLSRVKWVRRFTMKGFVTQYEVGKGAA